MQGGKPILEVSTTPPNNDKSPEVMGPVPRLQDGFCWPPAPPGFLTSTPVGLAPAAAGAREASKSFSSIHHSHRLPAQSVTALGGSQAKLGRQQISLACPQASWSDKEFTSYVDNGPHGMVDVRARPVGCGSKGIQPRSQGSPGSCSELAACQAKLASGPGPLAQPTLQGLLQDLGDSFTP